MSMYMLLCNYTDQAIRNMKDMPSRREAARAEAGLMTDLIDERAGQAMPVLLVEDDAPTSWRLQDALAKAGFDVTAAATLAEARASLTAGGPKVLLTDLQLPDGHGIELIRET